MTQPDLFAFSSDEEDELTFPQVLKLAKGKYANDWAVQEWLRVYERGTKGVTVVRGVKKKRKEKVKGIPPKSDFARKGLMRAVQLREAGKVRRWK